MSTEYEQFKDEHNSDYARDNSSGGSPAQPHDIAMETKQQNEKDMYYSEQRQQEYDDSINDKRNNTNLTDNEDGSGEAENNRIFQEHQRRLQERPSVPIPNNNHNNSNSNRYYHHNSSPGQLPHPTRSTSYLTRTQDSHHPRSSVAASEFMQHNRLRSIISSARFSAARRSAPLAGGAAAPLDRLAGAPLTEGERLAMELMMEREERRQAARRRVADDDARRGELLLQQEYQKEAATLGRMLELEEKKVTSVKDHQERRIKKTFEAKKRREALEQERLAKLEALRQRRERRVTYRDPYAMLTAKVKYASGSVRTEETADGEE